MSEKVTIIVKLANQSSIDQRLEADLNWNVQFLKEEISRTHSSNPIVKDQRLIYCGQLLEDSLLLKSALRHPTNSNEYTLHLVCSSSKQTKTSQPIDNHVANGDSDSVETVSLQAPSPSSSGETSSESSGNLTTPLSDAPTTTSSDTTPTTSSATPSIDYSAYQLEYTRQLYAHYMTHYMQYFQPGNAAVFSQTPDAALFWPSLPQPQPPNEPVQVAPQQNQNQPAQPAPNQDVGEMGGGLGVGIGLGGGRDWLDWAYLGGYLVALLGAAYVYSFRRLVFVAAVSVVVYLYQCGGRLGLWGGGAAPILPVAEQPIAEPDRANDEAEPPPTQNGDEDGDESEGGEGGEAGREPEAPAEEVEPPPSAMALAWTFVHSFFTSLIPEQPVNEVPQPQQQVL